MPRTHAFDLLESPPESAAVAALYGGVPLLKQLTRRHLLDSWAADADVSELEGAKGGAEWRDVRDELATTSLFGSGQRLVLVREADDFVSACRKELEQYVAEPFRSGVLILELASFPANTKLYKAVEKDHLVVDCRPPELKRGRGKPVPDMQRIAKWLCQRAALAYDCKLELTGAQAMLELIGLEFGLLDQELARLSLYAEPGGKMTAKEVRKLCGGWRSQTTWDMIDSALNGEMADALLQLDQLLRAGEYPHALFGQISWSLRRFAAAARIFTMRQAQGGKASLKDALKEAGFQPFRLAEGEEQLRRLGAERALRLLPWLMESDLALKGSHSQETRARHVLEHLIIRLAKPRARG